MEDKTTKIEAYIRGQLEHEELVLFEALLNSDPGLKEKVIARKRELKAIEFLIQEDLNSKMEEWYGQQNIKNIRKKKYWLRAAIILSVSILLSSFFYFALQQKNTKIPPQIIAEQYYVSFKSMKNNSTRSATLIQGESALNRGDFEKVDSTLELIQENDESYLYAQFLLGHSAFRNKDFQKAIKHFEIVQSRLDEKVDKAYSFRIDWDLGLAYLANGEIEKSKGLLIQIANRNLSFSENAREIMNKLKSNAL